MSGLTRLRSVLLVAGVLLAQGVFADSGASGDLKQLLISEAASAANTSAPALLGDPSSFVAPCVPLPTILTPHDGDATNDGGWVLVDFCSAGATGVGPATAPDCHHNDDDSAVVALPFLFNLYGDAFNETFINNNGNLSFGMLFSTFTSSGFPVSGFPMVAPFWGDVDTGPAGSEALGHVWQRDLGNNTFAVTWDNVGYYFRNGDKLNTFQVLLSDGNNSEMGIGNNVCFCYDDMQWTTGDASGGAAGFGGTPATVGANAGDGVDFFQIGRFDRAGAEYDGPVMNPDGVDFLDGLGAGLGPAVCFNAAGTNVPPIPVDFPVDNEFPVVCGEAFQLTVGFVSPESGQTTSVSFEDPDGAQAAGLSIVTTPGNPATVDLDWATQEADAGTYSIVLTATDDFVPAGETVETLLIDVECPDNVPPACNLVVDSGTNVATLTATDGETGIFAVELVPGSVNLTLEADFVPGASMVASTISLSDPDLSGIGIVRVSDGGGNTCESLIELGEFDPFGDIVVVPELDGPLRIPRPSPDTAGVRCVETEPGQDPDFTGIEYTRFDDPEALFDDDGNLLVDFLLSEGDGDKVVCCEFIDNNDNVSPPVCGTVTVDDPLYIVLNSFTAEIQPEGVLLRWSTTLEIDNLGFRVFRSAKANLGKERDVQELMLISPALIPAQGTEVLGAEYDFLDTTAGRSSGSILYYLEDVDYLGNVTRHGPVRVRFGSSRSSTRSVDPDRRVKRSR